MGISLARAVVRPGARPVRAAARRRDRGTVTAETAVALPALMLVLAAVLGAEQVAVAQVRCVDAARAGARSAARGDPADQARAVAARLAPAGSSVDVGVSGADVAVRVAAPVMVGPALPRITVAAGAVTPREVP